MKYYGPLVKGLRHRLFTAVTRVRIPYGLFLEDYPSPAEGNGLENRQAGKTVRGFESHILLSKAYRHNIMFVFLWRITQEAEEDGLLNR